MNEGRPCAIHPAQPIIGACNRCGDFGCLECLPDRRRCVRCAPGGIVAKPDIGQGFKWVFQDPDYASKILMGAGCMLLSVFLVPMFILIGYGLAIARREREAPQSRLPDWSDWGTYLWDGLKFYFSIVFLVLAVELAFAAVAGIVIAIIVLAGNAGSSAGAVIGGLVGVAAFITLIPLLLFFTYAAPALQIEYLRTNSVFAGFHLRRIWRIVSGRPGDYFMFFVGAFVTRVIGNFVGQLLCLVGILATTPWVFYTEGWLAGRYWAWLDQVEGLDQV